MNKDYIFRVCFYYCVVNAVNCQAVGKIIDEVEAMTSAAVECRVKEPLATGWGPNQTLPLTDPF